jgi:hypothetical protein
VGTALQASTRRCSGNYELPTVFGIFAINGHGRVSFVNVLGIAADAAVVVVVIAVPVGVVFVSFATSDAQRYECCRYE